MATYTVLSPYAHADLTRLGLEGIDSYEQISATASKMVYEFRTYNELIDANVINRVVFTGKSIVFSADGTPVGGTITGWKTILIVEDYGKLGLLSVTKTNIAAYDLWQAIDAGTSDEFSPSIFSGNDQIRGGNFDGVVEVPQWNEAYYGDILLGYEGNDKITGRGGDDELRGGNGNDSLAAGIGDDTIVGGAGADVCTGGTGADLFVFEFLSDSPNGKGNRDTIKDFRPAAGDNLDLSDLDLQAPDLSFAKGVLSADVNGDGQPEFEVVLPKVTSLPESALLL